MIPHGVIYNSLRSEMLATYPDDAIATSRDCQTIADWLANGSIAVTSCARNKIVFEAPQAESGSVLLTETESFFNHCFEQIQELGCFCFDQRTRSWAWNTVTGYYFSFFSASALLRLLGRPTVFLSRDVLQKMKTLASASVTPSAGAFQMRAVRQISTTRTEFELSQTAKLHEATWCNLFQFLEDRSRTSMGADANELLFYDGICTKTLFSIYSNYQWPSLVRARANYRAGYAYTLRPLHGSKKNVLAALERSPTNLVAAVREAAAACINDTHDFGRHVNLMFAMGFSVFGLARELYIDLASRKRIDRRWEHDRNRYRKGMVFGNEFEFLGRTFPK